MKLKNYLFLAGISISALASAQQYTMQTTQETYQDLQSPNVLTTGMIWDDEVIGIDIPFAFTIGGESIDSIFLYDGSLTTTNMLFESEDVIVNSDPFALLTFLEADLVDRAEHDGGSAASPISYEVLTENGLDVLAIEYKNAGFYDEDVMMTSMSSEDYVNVQIRLRADNTISIHYGGSNVSYPEEYFENEMGNVVALIPEYQIQDSNVVLNSDAYVLSDEPATPTLNVVSDVDDIEDNVYGLDAYPSNGTMYTFLMSNVGQEEFNQADIMMVNPVNQTLVYLTTDVVSRIEIIDVQGQIVLNTPSVEQVNVSSLATGTYIVKFYNGIETLAVKKMVKN